MVTGSARLIVKSLGQGVAEMAYSGFVTQSAFVRLAREGLIRTQDFHALIIRMDKCVHLVDVDIPLPLELYRQHAIPAAVVANGAADFDWFCAYARKLALIGVQRSVFLPEFEALAYQWAAREAAARMAVREAPGSRAKMPLRRPDVRLRDQLDHGSLRKVAR